MNIFRKSDFLHTIHKVQVSVKLEPLFDMTMYLHLEVLCLNLRNGILFYATIAAGEAWTTATNLYKVYLAWIMATILQDWAKDDKTTRDYSIGAKKDEIQRHSNQNFNYHDLWVKYPMLLLLQSEISQWDLIKVYGLE